MINNSILETDLYEILGVKSDSTEKEIKSAFREMAKKYHPDKNKGDKDCEEKFKKISEAYEILSNTNTRREYDLRREDPINSHVFNMGNIYEEFFRFNRNDFTNNTQGDLEIPIAVSLYEAFYGCSKTVNYQRNILCPDCNGEGSTNPSDVGMCQKCNGTGKYTENIFGGHIKMVRNCAECNGTGKVFMYPCKNCNSTGSIYSYNSVNIKIPKGMGNGEKFFFPNCGNQGKHGYSSLIITSFINEHPFFKRKKNDIYVEMPIPLHLAIVGGEIEIPTIHGKKKIILKPELKDGTKIKLRECGMPLKTRFTEKDPYFGDHIVICRIEMISKVDDQIKEMFSKIPISEETYPYYKKILVSIDEENRARQEESK